MVTFSYIYIFIFSGAKAYYIRFIGANEHPMWWLLLHPEIGVLMMVKPIVR